MDKILTIGAYGFTEKTFFEALLIKKVDMFCDIRRRRGMRGTTYAFANSQYLQKKLKDSGIEYIYLQELAPSQAIRDKQKQEDTSLHITKRERKILGQAFISAYTEECLSILDLSILRDKIGPSAQTICFFCVEREAQACHRSLVSQWLGQRLHIPVEHIHPSIVE